MNIEPAVTMTTGYFVPRLCGFPREVGTGSDVKCYLFVNYFDDVLQNDYLLNG